MGTRTLVCGWFSVDGGEATAGDLFAMEIARDVAAEIGPVDVAMNRGFPEGIDWREADPAAYDRLVFVCGPLHGERIAAMLDRFRDVAKIAVNVSVVDPALADRFDVVLARDEGDRGEPDLTFARRPDLVPVIGIVRAHPQPEYPGARHEEVHATLRLALASRRCATVDFDTRVHPAADPFDAHARSPSEVSALAARVDAVVATRLHGMVLSLAQGTPVVAVDPIEGGAKVLRQAEALGWPCVFTPETAHPEQLSQALTWCLTGEARTEARACLSRATNRLEDLCDLLGAAIREGAAR